MKWVARRVFLRSHPDMDRALLEAVRPVLDRMSEVGVTDWYCSRKNDDGRPSVRVYMGLRADSQERAACLTLQSVLSGLQYVTTCEDEPTPASTKVNLGDIQRACELALELMDQFPRTDRESDPAFLSELKRRGSALHASTRALAIGDRSEVIHFLANVLGLADDGVWKTVSSS